MLTRGGSPRIVSARVLGSRGTVLVSGPELAGRLGLDSTWEYFSVKNGSSVRREPDHSGQPPSCGAREPARSARTGADGAAGRCPGAAARRKRPPPAASQPPDARLRHASAQDRSGDPDPYETEFPPPKDW